MKKPNLLFIFTDQQRADTMAAYGNNRIQVPALNKLASQSTVFQQAYVTQPVCTPSRSRPVQKYIAALNYVYTIPFNS